MHACMHARMLACIFARVHACTHAPLAYERTDTCTHARIHAYMHTFYECKHARMHTRTHARMHASTQARTAHARTRLCTHDADISFLKSKFAMLTSSCAGTISKIMQHNLTSTFPSKPKMFLTSAWGLSPTSAFMAACICFASLRLLIMAVYADAFARRTS